MCRAIVIIMLLVILSEDSLPAQDQETPTTSATSQLAKDLIGTWILAGRPGNVVDEPEVIGGELKFIAGGHWCVTQADPNGKVLIHHGGTYTLNGNEYVEHVEYATDYTSYLINNSYTFKIKIEGDILTQVGIGNTWTQVRKRLNRPLTVDNYEESTPTLSVAVTLGDIEQVKSLLAKETDPDAKNAALQEACSVGNLDFVKLLIDNGADVNARSQRGPALYLAMMANHGQIAELLISKGADINMKNSAGQSILHFACQRGNKEIANLLINNGADVNASNNAGRTPLDLAEQRGHTEIVELLLKHGAKRTLLGAITSGNIEQVKALISEEIDPNAKNTALQEACSSGKLDIVKLLIDNRVDVNVKNSSGQTPLHLACQRGNRGNGVRDQKPVSLYKQR